MAGAVLPLDIVGEGVPPVDIAGEGVPSVDIVGEGVPPVDILKGLEGRFNRSRQYPQLSRS